MATKKVKKKKRICPTCGDTTTQCGHLCTPIQPDQADDCQYCGIIVGDPRHVCQPKLREMKYVCGGCGRTAVKRTELCNPLKIK